MVCSAHVQDALVHEKREQPDLFPAALQMVILRPLKRQHGYALAQHIKSMSNDLLQIEEGSPYPALQHPPKDGLVWRVSSTNSRLRIYKLTPTGVKPLEHEVSRFERMLDGMARVLATGES
jgi:DNA-binding PadR family transcriptional regulator